MTGDLHTEAEAALDRHDFTEATLSMFRTLIAREPREVGWWIAATRCLLALGRFDEAQRGPRRGARDRSAQRRRGEPKV